jgi:two-component system, response regulator / RNA-binding antiterminator
LQRDVDILIADTDPERASVLAARIAEDVAGARVRIAPPGRNLGELVQSERPDAVIVDMARPDRDSLEQVRGAAEQGAAVMLFLDEDDPDFMEAAVSAGVASYHVNAASIRDIKPILRSAIALFRRSREREARLAALELEVEERRRIEAAKRLLMRRDGMSEPAAHRFLQRRAMERQMRLADLASTVLGETGMGEAGKDLT